MGVYFNLYKTMILDPRLKMYKLLIMQNQMTYMNSDLEKLKELKVNQIYENSIVLISN